MREGQLTAHPRRVTVSMNAKFVGCTNHRLCHKMLQLPLVMPLPLLLLGMQIGLLALLADKEGSSK